MRKNGGLPERSQDAGWSETFKAIDEFSPELDAFAAAIQARRSVEPDGVEGHRDMIILDAIYESARKQEPVAIRNLL